MPANVKFIRSHAAFVEKVKSVIPKLLSNEVLNEEDSLLLNSFEICDVLASALISDLIYMQIVSIFKKMYSTENNSITDSVYYYTNDKEYIGHGKFNFEEYNKNINIAVLEKVKKLVNYYLGFEPFFVIVSFVSGKPHVSFS
jgi:hypothetical protein